MKWNRGLSICCAAICVVALLVGATVGARSDSVSLRTDIPEIHPGLLQGYLPQEALPNSLALLPPPPSFGSSAYAFDQAVSKSSFALRGSPRWALAVEDADLTFPKAAGIFSCALEAPIDEKGTPALYRLLRRSLTDAGLSTYPAKNKYQRARPFTVNLEPFCTPDEKDHLMTDGSYPSGHTSIGWAWALILAEIAPDRASQILARGRAFGESRLVCNVHWNSDVAEGRVVGAMAVAEMHTAAEFLMDLEAAKAEVAKVRATHLAPSRDCATEGVALSTQPPNGL